VPKLSIVIPALDSATRLEQTLVSVLENRPPQTEVLVALGFPYADPYDLAGEVRFVEAPPGADFATAANLGFAECAAPIVHLLDCGTEVAEYWTERPLDHLLEPRVAAVGCLVLDAADKKSIVSAAVDYLPSGRVVRNVVGRTPPREETAVLGAGLPAAFYRRNAVEAVGGFDATVGEFADVDLALRLKAAGWTALLEPRSRAFCARAASGVGFLRGRAAERLYLRNRPLFKGQTSPTRHLLTVAAQCALPSPSRLAALVGRLAARLERSRHRAHHDFLADLQAAQQDGPRLARDTERQTTSAPAPPVAAARARAA
jgi:GT2 family glycosyltransferase